MEQQGHKSVPKKNTSVTSEEQLLQQLHKMLSEQNYTDTEAMEELSLDYRSYWKYKAKLCKRVADINAKKGEDSIIYEENLLKERLARLGIIIRTE